LDHDRTVQATPQVTFISTVHLMFCTAHVSARRRITTCTREMYPQD
jgi:hypothetical protein